MKKVVLSVLSVSFLFVQGCCSIISGKTQTIPVSSTPPGAIVTADTGVQVRTPGMITLDRDKRHTFVATYPGYEPIQKYTDKKMNNWVWGNIVWGIIGAPVGIVIDCASGSVCELHPKELAFAFESESIKTKGVDPNR